MNPSMPKQVVKLGVVIVLGLVSMMLGVYGIYAGSMGEATLQVMGAHLNTIDVGVAFVAIGFAIEVVVFRAILQTVERGAARGDESTTMKR